MILHVLLVAILNALRRLIPRATAASRATLRPAHGPAHPRVRAQLARLATRPATPREPLRPARQPLPEHLAALLASAPTIEPDLVPKPKPALLRPFYSIQAHVRVYNPKPPAPDLRRAFSAPEPWTARLQRAVAALRSLVAPAGPPRGAALGL